MYDYSSTVVCKYLLHNYLILLIRDWLRNSMQNSTRFARQKERRQEREGEREMGGKREIEKEKHSERKELCITGVELLTT